MQWKLFSICSRSFCSPNYQLAFSNVSLTSNKACPGRPRKFDHDVVLDMVMKAFWQHGYEGTSINLIESKTGLAAPSLYAAFGNKRQLFTKSVERYREKSRPIHEQALAQPKSLLVAKCFLEGLVKFFKSGANPEGCLVIMGAVVTNPSSDPVRQYLNNIRTGIVTSFTERFERSIKEGDLPPNANSLALANYLVTLYCGLALQSKTNCTEADLLKVVSLALENWPSCDR